MTLTENINPAGQGIAVSGHEHRIDSIDLVRGLVIILMALDYFRDFLSYNYFQPTDTAVTTYGYFFTRWITHFCAPAFLFLAGTSASLMLQREKPAAEVALFLLKRGLLLIALELTIISFGWNFTIDAPVYFQVIYAIGLSMVLLSGLVLLPAWVSGAVGIAIIFGIGLVPAFSGDAHDFWHAIWLIMVNQADFRMGPLTLGPITGFVLYPAVPWFGAMALGFALGGLYRAPEERRRKIFAGLGIGLTALFILLRLINGYGDPAPWTTQATGARTFLSFLNVTKFPPSTLFLLMTLGPVLIALSYAEKARGAICRFFITFGRVPLFIYVVLVYEAHILQVFIGIVDGKLIAEMLDPYWRRPEDFGISLAAIYLIWALMVGALYPLCRWYADFKFARRQPLLSYF